MKALQHQSCLLQLDLSSNFIQNDGIKFLSQVLVTLKQLNSLDISGNMITESGVEYLCNALEKCQHPAEMRHLNLSFNPIRSNSLKLISRLCQTKRIASLSMVSCDLTVSNGLDELGTIKRLDISYNHLSRDGFKGFLGRLNPGLVEALNFERCTTSPDIGESLVNFISSGCYGTLKELNLAGLNLTENEILDVLRSVEKCEQLASLDLSHQKQFTFLSLKFLLSVDSKSLERVRLIGCKNLQDSSGLLNLHNVDVLQTSCLQNIQLSLPRASSESTRKDFIERIKQLWDVATAHRGKIDHDRSVLRMICDSKNDLFHH